jgi:hypothetical protein
LIGGYRRFGQRLQGHPTPVLPWVDVATGSLGQGLPDGIGLALAGKYLDGLPYRGLGAVRAWAGIAADHIREAATMLIAKSVVGSR